MHVLIAPPWVGRQRCMSDAEPCRQRRSNACSCSREGRPGVERAVCERMIFRQRSRMPGRNRYRILVSERPVWMAHFHGRSRSRSARQDSSYNAAAGVTNPASVSRGFPPRDVDLVSLYHRYFSNSKISWNVPRSACPRSTTSSFSGVPPWPAGWRSAKRRASSASTE
jgi:hypothetical protein